ncbi:MAG: GMP synthase [Deltaproteobacteria bacterium]|nr:GMP synthase [Deltaproteobacteria bacterium]
MSEWVILKTGTTLPELRARRGDYEDWFLDGLGVPSEQARVVAVYEGEGPPPADVPVGVVVTGSSAMVSDREPWSEAAAAWLRDAVAAATPVLGVCYGHQLLAHALGGVVAPNPRGREMGTLRLRLLSEARDDPLLGGFTDPLCVQATHVESVLELPAGARRLAESGLDANHAFAVGERAWGLQFHPEFDADVMQAYLAARREILRSEGIDPERLERRVEESPHGSELLRRFARLAVA